MAQPGGLTLGLCTASGCYDIASTNVTQNRTSMTCCIVCYVLYNRQAM